MKKNFLALAVMCLLFAPQMKADEGMWLLQLMKEQHLHNQMRKQGLRLSSKELYNSNGVSLKDAVGIFGNGCTGEIISGNGLILTNHHCGYGAIQQHSSVEHDYLKNGFTAATYTDELPTPGLKFTFIERIEDVTNLVNQRIATGEVKEAETFTYLFLTALAKELYDRSDLKDKPGIEAEVLPFYEGNKFYLFFKKVYSDVRMVAAPPSSIGKFGGETDNWMWPRHTGDFSIFRIYADKQGNPAKYSTDNVPLKTKKFLPISINGVQEGDYAMIMGFPGSTSRYLTVSEITERMEAENEPMIKVRTALLEVMSGEMKKNDKTRIQYANKFAGLSNYWKNSIGMNKALVNNHVREDKAKEEARFKAFAQQPGNERYKDVISQIDALVQKNAPLRMWGTYLIETFFRGIEFGNATLSDVETTLKSGTAEEKQKVGQEMEKIFNAVHNKDYDHEVDRKLAKRLLPLYANAVKEDQLPAFYKEIKEKFDGNTDAYVDDMYNHSILANKENLEKFLKAPTAEAVANDPAVKYACAKREMLLKVREAFGKNNEQLDLLHKTYLAGLMKMNKDKALYPDANFTLRLTYGNVKSYDPKDGVHYDFYTTAKGILEKEDPKSSEFNVPERLKQLILAGDFGRYAMKDGRLPVCFLTTNDITGGNSGSPVINGKGQLIGCAFDGNWESLSGDLYFDNKLQRCIALDIRYMLFVLDKVMGCSRLIDEMKIEK